MNGLQDSNPSSNINQQEHFTSTAGPQRRPNLSLCGMSLSVLLCGLKKHRRHEPVLHVSTISNLNSFYVIAISTITVVSQ